ncbi:MAG: ABC transporter permease [Dermatophilaceae bacterium]
MSVAILLAVQEIRSGWARSALKGVILLCAVGTQLFASLAAAASQDAVETYGAAVFGFAQTYRAEVASPVTMAQVEVMDDTLDAIEDAHPWAIVAVSVSAPASLTSAASPVDAPGAAQGVTSVHGSWRSISATMGRSAAFRELEPADAPPRVVVTGPLADRLGVQGSGLVSVTVPAADPAAPQPSSPVVDDEAGSATVPPVASVAPGSVLPEVPAFHGEEEKNRSLGVDAMASRSVLIRLGLEPDSGAVYWRCDERACADTASLAHMVAAAAGTRLSPAERIDTQSDMAPVLRQQREQGTLFSWVAIALGACAVTVVATALVEVRTPELVTLRTLGARRSTLVGSALIEGALVAAGVGLVSIAVALAAARLDPNVFNHIDGVVLERFEPPTGVLLRTLALTLAVGVLTSVLPAARAYRSVRAG